jgi:hypothetical protein
MHTSTNGTEVAETHKMTQGHWGPLLHVSIDGTGDGTSNEAFMAMPTLGKTRCLVFITRHGAPIVLMVHPFSNKGYDYLKSKFVIRSKTSSCVMLTANVNLRELLWNLHSETNARQSATH